MMKLKMSQAQFDRLADDMRQYAKSESPLKVSMMDDTIYVFADEIQVLRILAKYRHVDDARYAYSDSYQSHFFAMEMETLSGSFSNF